MHLPVSIPEPCHEQWDNMQARANGRHCNACEKTVVDFTGWEADDILTYLKSNTKTCGRFTVDQLQPEQPAVTKDFSWLPHIVQSGLSHMAKIAAAVILFFHLASCETVPPANENKLIHHTTTGKPLVAQTNYDKAIPGDTEIMGDTIMPPSPLPPSPIPVKHPEPVIMGEPAIVPDSPVVTVPEPQPQIMGAPVMIRPQQDSLLHIPEQD